jgi:hypothetical protein
MPRISLIFLVFLGLISGCGKSPQKEAQAPKRTETTLPVAHVRGAESSSFSLYAKGPEGTTTAIGQIFIPPESHIFLLKVGFLCRQAIGQNVPSDFNVKLRISPWEVDRPAANSTWVSDVALITKGFDGGWISFDVPHIKLVPNQKYVAWLSMAGLQNADVANFSIVSMGARTMAPQPRPDLPYQPSSWLVDYPEGTRAFWRHDNPNGIVDGMTLSPWITDASGQNLHFKMVFQNMDSSER